jgi:sigma-B regulation protein RsbU (phosphoserine phosphatase)
MTLRTRLLLTLVPAVLLLSMAAILVAFSYTEETLLQQINRAGYRLTHSNAKEFDLLFETSRKVAEGIALGVGQEQQLEKSRVTSYIRRTLKQNPSVYGSTVALLPEATPLGRFAPYLYRRGEKLLTKTLASAEYDYTGWDWFRQPLERRQGVWGEPYFDEGGGNVMMITYSVPIRRGQEYAGVATVDISLENLLSQVRSLRVGGTGYAFIVTGNGRLIAHPGKGLLSAKTLSRYADEERSGYFRILHTMVKAGDSETRELVDRVNSKSGWAFSSPIPSMGGHLVIIYPSDEILRPLHELKKRMLLAAAIVAAFILLIIPWVSSSVTSPLRRLVSRTEEYSRGDFGKQLDEGSGPTEMRLLSRAFNRMGGAITDHIETVRRTTAERERYHQELEIAAGIQQEILPRRFPPFDELAEHLDIYGITRPAREVGGDYYDFFRLHGARVALVVADVSGKGAAAALFMAMTHTLIRDIAARRVPPAEVLRRANRVLAEDNPSSMFVTLLYGEYDPFSGQMRLSSAGHNPPLVLGINGRSRQLDLPVRLPLGAMPDTTYEEVVLTLGEGEVLVLYTDGITEASDVNDNEWGMKRFAGALRGFSEDMRSLTDHLLRRVDEFAAGREQHDDITLLLLKRLQAGSDPACRIDDERIIRLTLPARTEVLAKVALITESVARDAGLNEQDAQHFILALDEVVSNVIMHAYKGALGNAFELALIPSAEGLEAVVIDYGIPFDFEGEVEGYDGEVTLESPIGGIGLFLARRAVDRLTYEPGADEGNRMSLFKSRSDDCRSDKSGT